MTEHMSLYEHSEARGGLRVDKKATRTDSKIQNRRFVLQCIYGNPSTSRADVSRTTGLTRATVSEIVSDLLDEGLVLEVGTAPSGGGKPPTLLAIAEDSHHLITVRLGASRWTGSLLTLRRRIIRSTTVNSAGRRGAPAIDALREFVGELIDSTPEHVLGIGIATPGTVTPDGMVREATMIDWHGAEVGELLTEHFSIPTHVANDANAIALAEHSLGAHQTNDLLAIKIGTGVGMGVIVDGRPFAGEGFAAGEIGHISILASPFGNGGHGTIEDVTSAVAFARHLGIGDPSFVDSGTVFRETARRLAAGDGDAIEMVDNGGKGLGTVLAMATGILDVKTVVVCGPVTQLGEAFLESTRSEMVARAGPAHDPRTQVVYGTVDRAEEHGAAMLVLIRELGIL
ncbi:MAG: ROK family transcriptional regulator [Actinomycetia bacterium]|nr:ROK family transcriptional regulator [Actinomycetes bacterium]